MFSSLLVGESILSPYVIPLVVVSDRPPQFYLLVGLTTPWESGARPANWIESIRPKKALEPDPPPGFFPSPPEGLLQLPWRQAR